MPLSEIGCNYLELAEFRAKRHQQLESKSNASQEFLNNNDDECEKRAN
ncbi:14742_t:CDS:1, partial [Racocetra persica]